ncbi:iron ABC transporter permease [Acidocella sp.]|uniref:ABC transporter permease n=1 Tax=Acidocella sp. TaxID=50710 RepID=UPI0026381D6B|nr:ABC transporter permease subunit [Acidocella sp.]
MSILRILALMLLAGLFIYPLGRLLVLPLWVYGGAGLALVPFRNSVMFALAVGLIVAPLGALLAHALENRDGLLVRALGLVLWLLFLTPGYVLTTGWLAVLTVPLLRNGVFGHWFLGPGGLLFLYALKSLPFSVFVARSTFAEAGAGLMEAARVLGVAPWRRHMLNIRLALPAMAAAFTIAGIETMQEFGIPATLGVTARIPVLTYEIYSRLNTTPTDFAGAALLCWWLIGSAAMLAILQAAVQRRHLAALVSGRTRRIIRTAPGKAGRLGLGAGLVVLGGLGLLVPFASLAQIALTGGDLTWGNLDAVPRSLGYGMLAATVALSVGLAVLKLQRGRSLWFNGVLQGLLAANMAVPGLILGAGYVLAFNNDFLPLYGTVSLLIIAYAAGVLPIGIRLLGTAFSQLDVKLTEAARIFALPVSTRLIDIEAALLARPGLYAWMLVVAAVMFELPISELLYVPGATPLGVAIVSADMMANYGQAAQLALLGMMVLAAMTGGLLLALQLTHAPRAVAEQSLPHGSVT